MAIRIHQLAKELELENKELVDLLVSRGFTVKSVSSTIDNISADSLREEFAKKRTTQIVSNEAPPAPAKPNIPAGAIVRSAEDVARERASRVDTARPTPPPMRMPSPVQGNRVPPPVRLPVASKPLSTPPAPPSAPIVKPMAPPAVKMPPLVRPSAAMPPPAPAPKSLEEPVIASEAKGAALQVKPPVVVRDFALLMGVKPFKLISALMEMGVFASMNQTLDSELATQVAAKFGFTLEIKHRGDSKAEPPKKKEAPKVDEKLLLKGRPPIVCILGHVDHGKTTLLDFIRKANVVAGEAGGITQHIGAYQIEVDGKKITFLDTPGHSAFEKMRARGAGLTDIAILVIAADDGFMPQTDEALKHCRKSGVPVMVAINKIDTKGSNPDRVKKQMQERNLLPEEWGGEVITVPVSALSGQGVPQLLEMILLQAEVLELTANPAAPAEGAIVESKLETGRGPTATVIVQKGTLKAGDSIVCGAAYCKVRSLLNERDEKIDTAPPSTPVRIIGWSQTPEVGSHFVSAKNEREAKAMAEEAAEALLKERRASSMTEAPTNAAELLAAMSAQEAKVLNVVVKADVSGSLEAVVDALNAIKSEKVSLHIVESSVGAITLSDVDLAHTAKASIVAFNTRQENGVSAQLKHHQVSVISHNIIYELVTQVREAMVELLDPILQEHTLGKAEIRQVFDLSKGTIAGCMVTEGSIFRDKLARLWRGKELVAQGRVSHLKRGKDDASEVKAGFECGILLSSSEAFKEGDVIECYQINQVRAQL